MPACTNSQDVLTQCNASLAQSASNRGWLLQPRIECTDRDFGYGCVLQPRIERADRDIGFTRALAARCRPAPLCRRTAHSCCSLPSESPFGMATCIPSCAQLPPSLHLPSCLLRPCAHVYYDVPAQPAHAYMQQSVQVLGYGAYACMQTACMQLHGAPLS